MNTENKMEELEKSMHGMIDAAFRLQKASENVKRGNNPNYPSGSFVGNGGAEYVKGKDTVVEGFKKIADTLFAAPDEHDFCANAQSPKHCDCSCEMPDDASCKEMKIRDLQERVNRLLEMNSNLRGENDILHDKISRISDIAK